MILASSIESIINYIITEAVNPFIAFLFGLAALIFIIGVVEFIANADNEEKRIQGRSHMTWGILGLVIMTAVGGFMWIIVNFWCSIDAVNCGF